MVADSLVLKRVLHQVEDLSEVQLDIFFMGFSLTENSEKQIKLFTYLKSI